jgi:hypothetical protein
LVHAIILLQADQPYAWNTCQRLEKP